MAEEPDDVDEDYLDQFDSEYFYTHPPRCIEGFIAKPLRDECDTAFQLTCVCGSERGKVLGYSLAALMPTYSGPLLFVTPLGFSCAGCGKSIEIIDTGKHGYNAELGSDSNIRGQGERQAYPCPKCCSEEMKIIASFTYDDGTRDLKQDEPHIIVENYFGVFAADGICAKCGERFSIGGYELA